VAGEDPVRLYIYAARSVDGFIESTRVEDSAKDIRGAFKDKKSILLVDSADAADVTLEVKFSGYAPSGVKSETALRKGTFGGIDSTTTVNAVSLPAIGTILRVRGTEFEKEFSVMSQSFWKVLAGYVATNVDDWIKTNWRQLKEKTR
jgi:hypothetical protein